MSCDIADVYINLKKSLYLPALLSLGSSDSSQHLQNQRPVHRRFLFHPEKQFLFSASSQNGLALKSIKFSELRASVIDSLTITMFSLLYQVPVAY